MADYLKAPLQGIKVLDLSRFISGPYCAMLLGDLGAEVIKIEKAGAGDESRHLPPYYEGESLYCFVMNRNKRGMELDFRSEEGKKILGRMIKNCDVIIQNFRPGTMEKMGYGWDTVHDLNEKAIMVSISGFGADGPLKDKPGFDAAIQAMSGLMSITGEPDGMPMMYGTYTVDYSTAMYAATSVCAALYARKATGVGQHIELSLLECAATLLMTGIPEQVEMGHTTERVGNRDRYTSPGNCFTTKDGSAFMIIAGNQTQFQRLVKAMHKEYLLEDERFSRQDVRFLHAGEIEGIVAEWVACLEAEELRSILDEHSIVATKIETLKDVVDNPQLSYRKKLVKMKHPKMGEVTMMGTPFNFSNMELDLSRPAPMLGEHTEEILKEWLYAEEEELRAWKEKGII